jgi:transcriptional regulator with XRE-family HTH domain
MPRKPKIPERFTGLYYAREARKMSRTELVRRSGISKQQLSRLENGQIRLRLDHLKPFAGPLDYTPEQILLWGKLPGTGDEASTIAEASHAPVREIDSRLKYNEAHKSRRGGRNVGPGSPESWLLPSGFVQNDLHTTPEHLLIVAVDGDAMTPTMKSGDRVIIDTGHTTPSPDGLYAIRDPFERIVIRRLQLRSAKPIRVKLISDNQNHAAEEVVLGELDVVGKVLCCIFFV